MWVVPVLEVIMDRVHGHLIMGSCAEVGDGNIPKTSPARVGSRRTFTAAHVCWLVEPSRSGEGGIEDLVACPAQSDVSGFSALSNMKTLKAEVCDQKGWRAPVGWWEILVCMAVTRPPMKLSSCMYDSNSISSRSRSRSCASGLLALGEPPAHAH